jgi:hypothetical protein
LQKLALFCVKNANIFAKFFGENILKIITSVPDWANFRPMNDCLPWAVRGHCMHKEMPVILVDRAVEKKRIIGKMEG